MECGNEMELISGERDWRGPSEAPRAPNQECAAQPGDNHRRLAPAGGAAGESGGEEGGGGGGPFDYGPKLGEGTGGTRRAWSLIWGHDEGGALLSAHLHRGGGAGGWTGTICCPSPASPCTPPFLAGLLAKCSPTSALEEAAIRRAD